MKRKPSGKPTAPGGMTGSGPQCYGLPQVGRDWSVMDRFQLCLEDEAIPQRQGWEEPQGLKAQPLQCHSDQMTQGPPHSQGL